MLLIEIRLWLANKVVFQMREMSSVEEMKGWQIM